MASYLAVSCHLPAAEEERLATLLEAWPVLGCQVEGVGVEILVTVFLQDHETSAAELVSRSLADMGGRDLRSGPFAAADWLAEYRERVGPFPLGTRFWVDPHPDRPSPPPEGRIHLIVEPRQAFGTGSHESTQLVLLLLEDDPPAQARVLDVGTGSGILAMASRALGATAVIGFDIDLEAVFVARQTVAGQAWGDGVTLFCGPSGALRGGPRFDVVLANLLPSQFEPLLEDIRGVLAVDGRVVLSGLMADQRASVEAELAKVGLSVVRHAELGEWVGLVCAAR